MSTTKTEREYFLDSIRACLMLLGVPFHVSLIYSSQKWAVNSSDASLWLTTLNDFIHAFRMQVFFVISGYFSYMLYLRYQPRRFLKVRLERVGIPMLTAVPLITLPQFFMLKAWTSKYADWSALPPYAKFNNLMWELISHLWFLLVLLILTTLGMITFRWLRDQKRNIDYQRVGWGKLALGLLIWGLMWGAFRRVVFYTNPTLLSDALFNFVVMQSLFYLPFFMLGALSWKHQALKQLFVRVNPVLFIGAVLLLVAYIVNQRTSSGEGWLYELDALISSMMGLCMLNVCYSLGHKLLNSHSPGIMYLVNASLFIYLVHHPLTLLYGIYVTPVLHNNTLGFLLGLVMVFGVSFTLYELHLRIPLLRFLFSGKPQKR
ncbi:MULTISPECIES: glucans biosynthesis protein MdoC [Pantoea]|jgi:glucan biosynthesis protein C|uniref:Glucans biosynthesis protein C n=2 Tax=Pantoea ananas TaxID=553 RepID=A0A0H3KYW8_PANAA|nr:MULTISPECIES: glucans biosynthesis protein MdoC [Pantoea]AER33206.1 glucans biosynthesis protein C MdoC [Pantoea ananatis PA13]AVG76507.1 glucans biosynthesis protein MdoC [Pantoea ananatis]ERM11591.1 glucan biosynthesis protein [Pantoea ananatis BRT175]MBA4822249.1 glucans biosynthesis protein MdoC [Pantoea ananatis]MCH9269007.1 glucans biosynthesis protein MdoC [Pantoea ananatis]